MFFTLGVAKVPGIAFDIVGAARLGPRLAEFDNYTPELARAARLSFASNLVTLGLHGVSIGSFLIASFLDEDWEDLIVPTFGINAAADLASGVLGLVAGVDVILQRNAAGLTGTPLGTAATWSGAINIAMGAFGVIWFLPMTIGFVVGASALASKMPTKSIKAIALVPNGAGAALVALRGKSEGSRHGRQGATAPRESG
ncbi:MAG: hypothetical protein GY898_34155 [Proteobacteria bacterium]|nr:hypothetical protein [Pseudomonadota bacterium]